MRDLQERRADQLLLPPAQQASPSLVDRRERPVDCGRGEQVLRQAPCALIFGGALDNPLLQGLDP
jgi:hypothetical protein